MSKLICKHCQEPIMDALQSWSDYAHLSGNIYCADKANIAEPYDLLEVEAQEAFAMRAELERLKAALRELDAELVRQGFRTQGELRNIIKRALYPEVKEKP